MDDEKVCRTLTEFYRSIINIAAIVEGKDIDEYNFEYRVENNKCVVGIRSKDVELTFKLPVELAREALRELSVR